MLDTRTTSTLRALRTLLGSLDGDASSRPSWEELSASVASALNVVERSRDPYVRGQLLPFLRAAHARLSRGGGLHVGDLPGRLDSVLATVPASTDSAEPWPELLHRAQVREVPRAEVRRALRRRARTVLRSALDGSDAAAVAAMRACPLGVRELRVILSTITGADAPQETTT